MNDIDIKEKDITLRGSGELMHLIKNRSLTIEDIIVFCDLIWDADENGLCNLENNEWTSGRKSLEIHIIDKLSSLNLVKKISEKKIMLNPHVAGIGGSKKRGELRLIFKKLK